MSDKAEGTAFYIGANTSHGFVNDTSELMAGLKKLYIIKGGPGTGKSTLMRRFAEAAKRNGYEADMYYCSSDSSSLDGVRVSGIGVGIIDGTSPHSADPKYPGAYDEIIDLGACWDTEKLSLEYPQIKEHVSRKSVMYGSVYKYLSAVSALRGERSAILKECCDIEKSDSAAHRIIQKIGRGDGFEMKSRRISAIGMNGRTYLDTFEKMSDMTVSISDCRGVSDIFMEQILDHAKENMLKVWVSRNYTDRIDALHFPEKKCAVISGEYVSEPDKTVNTERFVIKDRIAKQRMRLRFISKTEAELMSRIEDIFGMISKEHFALERIYRDAMDFAGVEKITNELIEQYFPAR